MARKKNGGLVAVYWWDAGSGADEEEAADHHRVSVGFQINRNRKGIWISMEEDCLSGVHFILRAMIERVVELPSLEPPKIHGGQCSDSRTPQDS